MKIEKLMAMSDKQLYTYIMGVLDDMEAPYFYNDGGDYLVTDFGGELPLICIHMDTVSKTKPNQEDILEHKGLLFLAPQSKARCLGADDRAGIWMALEMLKSGTKTQFNYGFFDGEESGCIGAKEYAKNHPKNKHQCFIGLDRACRSGVQNIATYGYDNKDLVKVFTDFSGYVEKGGSVSDCSSLAASFDKPCLNLSIGYEHEHTDGETLNVEQMLETLDVMKNIIIPMGEYEVEDALVLRGWSKSKVTSYDWIDYDFTKPDETGDVTTDFEYEDWEENELLPVVCEECGVHAPLYAIGLSDMMLCEGCLSMYGFSTAEVKGALA
jgi:hypothetical protein